jgi:acyl-CoA thioester hydrolase
MNNPPFHVKMNLRIDWSDLDFLGHVNNIVYFRYTQTARINYLEKLGFTELSHVMSPGPILASTKCDFRLPLFYPGNILIESRVDFIKTTSFGLDHRIWNDHNELVAEAHDVLVWYDYATKMKVKLSDEIRRRIESLEGRTYGHNNLI